MRRHSLSLLDPRLCRQACRDAIIKLDEAVISSLGGLARLMEKKQAADIQYVSEHTAALLPAGALRDDLADLRAAAHLGQVPHARAFADADAVVEVRGRKDAGRCHVVSSGWRQSIRR